MLEKIRTSAEAEARSWISEFGRSLASGDAAALAQLFVADSHWRSLCGLSWEIATFSGAGRVADELCRRAHEAAAAGFDVDTGLLVPRRAVVAGQEVIEAIFRFDTANGPAVGVFRLLPSPGAAPKAWTQSTLLDMDRISATKSGNIEPVSHNRDFAKRNWLEDRQAEIAFEGREPDVLVVGGGHAGISAAVELKRLGLDTLVIDRQQRVGDNWRLRYHGLKLHNKTPVNHLRYMPFPPNWPDYIPKDKLANWLESYVESMEVNFWTGTVFEGAEYNEATQTWMARIRRGNGSVRMLRPKHIVMATSVSGTPNIPTIATIENFAGKVLHSSQFSAGSQWRGKSVVVMGTGTSAHDICQELQANGVDVTMVQRSPTMVVNVDPSAQLYDKSYLGDGPAVEIRDLLNASVPLEVVTELIADGKIRLIQASDIGQFISDGLELNDGSTLRANLVVLATGYKGQDHIVGSLFGPEVATRVGLIWGFDAASQEMRNMWTRTRQPGLWFTGGSFSQCRIYSRFLALQIDAIEQGRLEKAS